MPEYSYIVCHEQLTQLVGGFFECVPIVTCSIQTNESSGCIFCVNDVEQGHVSMSSINGIQQGSVPEL